MTDEQKDLLREYVALKPQPRELGLAIEAALKEVERMERLLKYVDAVKGHGTFYDVVLIVTGSAPEDPNDEQIA